MTTLLGWMRNVTVVVAIGLLTVARGLAQAPPAAGPEHAQLKAMEGEWTALIKSMGSESKGNAKYKLTCGGLWLVSDFEGEFAGQKFLGHGVDGYDPEKKKYVSVWVDSMSTRPMTLEGDFDKEKKVLTMLGEGKGPDGGLMKFKSVTRHVDADHHVFKMLAVGGDGSESEMITIEYTRKK